MSMPVEAFEDFVFGVTKRFGKRTPESRYMRLTDNILRFYSRCGADGPMLALGVWMWRAWKFGGVDHERLPTFGDYVRFRLSRGAAEDATLFLKPGWAKLKQMYSV